jgi:transaldolase
MAAGEMGCHSATISHTVLDQLAKLKYNASEQPGEGAPKPVHVYKNLGPTPARLIGLSKTDPLTTNWDGTLASTDIDYLANGGAELEKAIESDPVTVDRLAYALKLFIGDDETGETSSRKKCEEAMAQV